MYRLVNGSRETMREAFQTLTGNELEVVLAEQDLTVYFSRTHIIDLNVSAVLRPRRARGAVHRCGC
jgi:hypothetical protein